MAKAPLTYENIYPLILEQTRKWFAKKLNPFNLCPNSLTYWIIVPPYSAIGITISDLNNISIYWRQQIEPNETSYLFFKIIEMRPPASLTLLILFSNLGITIADAIYRVLEIVQAKYAAEVKKLQESLDRLSDSYDDLNDVIAKAVTEENQQNLASLLNPFRLTSRLSIFFPVNEYTSIGFLTIDFRHIEYSVEQLIEPNKTIGTIFRFLDFYSPFPLQITTMSLSVGLFITGAIYKYSVETREEIIDEVKKTFQH